MTQQERLLYLIQYLKAEDPSLQQLEIPTQKELQKQLLRSLMNIRPPKSISQEFIVLQDQYLQAELAEQHLTTMADLFPLQPGIYLWQGDITTLAIDAIVNAANQAMLGCFIPCHRCIDNAIHWAAGVQLRLDCASIMEQQGTPEPTGTAKITEAYNLPCRYVLHTVGPIVRGQVTQQDCFQLASCYCSCLALAAAHQLSTIAFCCISTGEFHFPNEKAAEIALQTVMDYQQRNPNTLEVIFNVFNDYDAQIYQRLLTPN